MNRVFWFLCLVFRVYGEDKKSLGPWIYWAGRIGEMKWPWRSLKLRNLPPSFLFDFCWKFYFRNMWNLGCVWCKRILNLFLYCQIWNIFGELSFHFSFFIFCWWFFFLKTIFCHLFTRFLYCCRQRKEKQIKTKEK